MSEYGVLVSSLRKNAEFMRFVNRLRIELAGEEFKNPKTANKRIADYFYYNNANERFTEVDYITRKVRTYGKQASSHISIYYAMYLEE